MATATLSRSAPARLSNPARPSDLISVGKAANLLGVSTQAVRNHLSRGELDGYTLASGHRRLSRRSVLEMAGESTTEDMEREKVVIYCRVSTSRQASEKKTGSSDLKRQIERLTKVAKEKYPDRELVVIKDVGSGMNFSKPGLDELLTKLLNGEFRDAKLLVEHKDRLARWAVPLIEKVASHAGVEIEYVEQQELGDEEMLVADLLAITTIFSAKLYSSRSSERRKKKLSGDFITRATELNQQGLTVRSIAQRMELEGFRDERGGIVSHQVIHNNILKPLDELQRILPTKETAVQRYIRENTEARPLNYRLKITDFYAHYLTWCKKENVAPVTKFRLTSNLPNKVRRCGYLKGVIVKGKNLHTTVKVVKEHVRTTRLNEKLAEFCKEHGLSFGAAQQKLQTV